MRTINVFLVNFKQNICISISILPRRYELLDQLHRNGAMSIQALAKLLQRHYKNVYEDVKLLEQIGLMEKTKDGLFSLPWDEVTATFRLVAYMAA